MKFCAVVCSEKKRWSKKKERKKNQRGRGNRKA